MSMCLRSWDGEHEWELVEVASNPEWPEDEDAALLLWECAICVRTCTTEQWVGAP